MVFHVPGKVPATAAHAVLLMAWALACGPRDPVTFSNMRVEEVGPTRAVLRFTTSEPTSCWAEHGPASGPQDRKATDPDMPDGQRVVDHEVPLEDLDGDTAWRVVARVETEDKRTYRSNAVDFRTLPGAAGVPRVNRALGATVSAVSSNFGGGGVDSGFGANRAVDGQMSTEWSSHGDGNAAFVEVDLGAPTALTHVGFRSRKMSDGTSIITRFELLLDGTTRLGPFETPDPDTRYELPLEGDGNITHMATRVRLVVLQSSGGNTGIKEWELLGP